MLCAIALATVASILGRLAGRAWTDGPFGPIPGDFELVELGVGIAIFSFLPWCHWQGGNVSVDLIARHLPRRFVAAAARLAEALFALLVAAILVQLCAGAVDLARFGETTMVLRLPVWWAYGPAIASSGLWLLVIVARLAARPGVGADCVRPRRAKGL